MEVMGQLPFFLFIVSIGLNKFLLGLRLFCIKSDYRLVQLINSVISGYFLVSVGFGHTSF